MGKVPGEIVCIHVDAQRNRHQTSLSLDIPHLCQRACSGGARRRLTPMVQAPRSVQGVCLKGPHKQERVKADTSLLAPVPGWKAEAIASGWLGTCRHDVSSSFSD